jgi:hypothetical protein
VDLREKGVEELGGRKRDWGRKQRHLGEGRNKEDKEEAPACVPTTSNLLHT